MALCFLGRLADTMAWEKEGVYVRSLRHHLPVQRTGISIIDVRNLKRFERRSVLYFAAFCSSARVAETGKKSRQTARKWEGTTTKSGKIDPVARFVIATSSGYLPL